MLLLSALFSRPLWFLVSMALYLPQRQVLRAFCYAQEIEYRHHHHHHQDLLQLCVVILF
jgi:hypothetical protein